MDDKIIITAPNIYSQRLYSSFVKAGFSNIHRFPTIKNGPTENRFFDLLFKNLSGFDFVILPSRNAIDAFVENAKRYHISTTILKQVKYITIGRDEDYLMKFGFASALKPDEASTLGIFNSLKNMGNINKLAVLTPVVEGFSEPRIIPDFIANLKTIAYVARISAYVTRINKKLDKDVLTDIKKGHYKLIVFTSGGEIESLKNSINNDTIFRSLKAACFGPFTASTAQSAGLKPVFIGTDFNSFDGFVKELKEFLSPAV